MRAHRIAALTLGCLGLGCGAPELDAIEPDDGYPRQLLGVDGDTLLARVVWDVGLPTETTLPGGFLGTRYFQVPNGASVGSHPVALRNSDGTSDPLDVTVLAPSGRFPAPRIEDVGVLSMTGDASPDLLLTVAAANLDVEATLTVNGSAVATALFWGGLPVDYQQDHVPVTFGYPVYHYGQVLGVLEDVTLGSSLTVMVTNSDGQTDTTSYVLPASKAQLDGDNDSLLDTWESAGYTAPSGGTIAIDAMGADPARKTILVEVDWIAAANPNAGIWATIEDMFVDAPVLNPNGTAGIDILIDRGQGGAFTGGGTALADHTTMDFGPNASPGYTDFFTYKGASFDNDRLNIFHYAIFGRARPNGSSGRGEVWGNDFMVTFVNFGVWTQALAQAGTFVHELGHNLGLTHGDLNSPPQWNETRKPNFSTSMSYRYQFPGVSVDCDFVSEGVITYSQGTMARINETTVNESVGICDNQPLDMNGDGNTTGTGPLDTSQDGDTNDVHDDFDQWGNMLLDFDAPGSRWNSN